VDKLTKIINMKTIKHYRISIPFGKELKEEMKEYQILAQNKYGKLCVNDYSYTTLQVKKEKYGCHTAINEVKVWKQKWNMSGDGWHAECWFQCTEKVMRRKVLTALKKEIQKEYYFDSEALNKLDAILRKRA